MQKIRYFDGQRIRQLDVQGAREGRQRAARPSPHGSFVHGPAFERMRPEAAGDELIETLKQDKTRMKTRFRAFSETDALVAPAEPGETTIVPTETVAIDSARKSDLQWLRRKHGMVVVDEGSHGKALMRVPDEATNPVQHAADAALALQRRGGPAAAHPNFLRVVQRTPLPEASPGAPQWALDNPGQPGLIGADVHALAAWTVTTGDTDIRVAVLDEGVDTKHAFLKPALVAEKDFVDGNSTAMPDGDDAHGTSCAGIVLSRNSDVIGVAPNVSLVAARIAKSDGHGMWIFDDFATADAIDWCWDQSKADVLSNSWGGGPPAPVITRAFGRARKKGRGGRGAVVVIAAGNNNGPVSYPGSLDEVVTVGASNQWDKRKSPNSQDGENWWGSNFGKGLDLMAPGVAIATADITGARGYSPSRTTDTFNGTSSATPFVAGAAALILTAKPELHERRVGELLKETADSLTGSKRWDSKTGYGRLNAYAAVRAARRE